MKINNLIKFIIFKLFFVIALFLVLVNPTLAADAVSGTFVSWNDYDGPVDYGTITWTETAPANTSIVVKVRSSNYSDMSDATDWASCSAVTSGTDISANSCVDDGDRYLEYQVTLQADDPAVAVPEVSVVQVNTDNRADNLISTPFDSEVTDNEINNLVWLESLLGSSDIRFHVRTSADNVTWGDWIGPGGTSATYFTDPTGGEIVHASSSDGIDDRWMQYQVYLISDGTNKATLSDINLRYDELDPIVDSVGPVSTDIGESTTALTISGSDFVAGATVKLVNGEDEYTATDVVVVSSSEITCNFAITNVMVDIWDLQVTNTNLGVGTLTDGFTIYNISTFSSWRDLGLEADFGTMTWSQVTPVETSIEMRARSAVNSNMSDATAWTSCDTITSGEDISDNNCITDGHRYVEYQVTFSTSEKNSYANVDNVLFNFEKSDELVSTPYNTEDAANLLGAISWSETVPAGTEAKFQIRTSPDNVTWTDWCGPDDGVADSCDSTTYFSNPAGAETIDDILSDGVNDQWMQYRLVLYTSGLNKPIVSDVTLTYVVNAIPQLQAVTASMDTDGNVNISYETRDTDASTGTNTPDEFDPSFEFWNGTAWVACSTLGTGDTDRKAIDEVDYTTFTATWTAATDFPDQFQDGTAKIRVIVDDNEAANNIIRVESNTFTLDTDAPALGVLPILVNAKTVPATLTLDASDDSVSYMKISLLSNLSDASWQAYNSSATTSLATDPDTVYVQFKDEYGNQTVIRNVTTLMTPLAMMVQDTTNIADNPPYAYRLFIAWRVVDDPPAGFSGYQIYRSADNISYTLLETINDRTFNYYADDTPEFDEYTYYKVAVLDDDGNTSYYSAVVQGKANGIQDAGEGGGGTETTPPVISNVATGGIYTTQATITWDTNELANSTIGYSAVAGNFTNEMGLATMANTAAGVGAHSITLTGLDPDTDYYYKVQSIDASSNIASSTPDADGYTFHTLSGAVILSIATVVNNTGFTISWNTDIAANSYVVYSENSDMSGYSEQGSSDELTGHSLSITGLTAGTNYYYYVKSGVARDDNGAEYYTLKTTQDTTAPIITFDINTDLTVIGDSAANISWFTNEQATSTLMYGTTTDYFLSASNAGYATNHSYRIENLDIGTLYYFKLLATDINANTRTDDNLGAGYTFETVDTTDITAPVISNVEASLVTDVNAFIVWDTDEVADSLVQYGTVSGTYGSNTALTALTRSHGVKLTSLSFNTNYFYRVISADGNGNTATSTEYTFATLEELSESSEVDTLIAQAEQAAAASSGGGGVIIIDKTDKIAPVISEIKVSKILSDSAEVRWKTNESADSLVEYGETVGYGDLHGKERDSTQNHFVLLKWLTPETTYNYRVTSSDTWANLAVSGNLNFTTLSKEEELIQELERELTFEEVEELTQPKEEIAEETLAIVAQRAIDMMKNLANKVSLAELEKSLNYQVSSIEELSLLIPSPLLTGEPRVVITATTATIAWITDKDSSSLVSVVNDANYDSNVANPYLQTSGNASERVLNHVVTIYELEPDTTYHYQVKSQGNLGPIAESRDFTFTTAKEILEIANYSTEVISGEIAVFKWVTNIEADSEVRYTPYRNNILSVDETETQKDENFSIIHEVKIEGFEAGVTYRVELFSHDLNENITSRDIEIFSTADDDLPPMIYQVQTSSALSPGEDIRVQTIISWYTNEPSTTRLYYEEGLSQEEELIEETKLDTNYTKKHVVVLTKFEPGKIYRFKVESIDSGGNVGLSKAYTVLTPRQSESVFQVIMNNIEGMFGWMKNVR